MSAPDRNGLDALAEVMGLLEEADFGELSVSGTGYLLEDKHMVGDGVDGTAAPAFAAAVNYLRKHGEAIRELVDADREYDEAEEAARGFIEDGYEIDSYGVDGSDFDRCLACDAESGAGVLNKGVSHDPTCVRHRYEQAIQRRAAALAHFTTEGEQP